MWLPLTKARWQEDRDLHERCGMLSHFPHLADAVVTVKRNADWLLEHLYLPDAEVGACVTANGHLLRLLGAPKDMDELVNWGDLSASVERKGGIWLVTLEEAGDGQCPNLCWYVQTWLEKWGWIPIIVQSTW